MIDPKILAQLEEALNSIRKASDERTGWQYIIALYEKAIDAANRNKYFSVVDATRIYLEFNSDYSSDIFMLMDKTAADMEKYFKNLLGIYISCKVGTNNLDKKIKTISQHADIFEEFINFILSGEKFDKDKYITVEGYSAERLTAETILSPLGAFNYLIYLREDPEEALADLKAQLPHRKVFNQTDLEEVQKTMDEKITPNEIVEEAAESIDESPAPAEIPAPTDSPAQDEAPAPSSDIIEKLNAVQQALTDLQEKFDDKIAEDTHKNGLFDNMHRELIRYQNGALDKIVDTIALDIIQLVDTTKGHVRVYEKKDPTEENYKKLLRIVKGIAEDLDDILYRQNIESYRVPGHEVDVRRQKIIQTVPTDDKSKDNLVAVRAADGYEKGDKVLRPERIKIFKYEVAPETPSEN